MIIYFTFFEEESQIKKCSEGNSDFKIETKSLKKEEIEKLFANEKNMKSIIEIIEKMTTFDPKNRMNIHDVIS